MIYINGSVVNHNGTFVWFDLDNPTAGWRSPASVTGSSMTGYGPGLVWHPASGKFIGWNGSGVRSALLTLTPPANLVTGVWAWNSVPAAASNGTTPSAQAQNGTYGRFNLVQDLAGSGRDFLVLLNGVAQATFAYKLPASGL